MATTSFGTAAMPAAGAPSTCAMPGVTRSSGMTTAAPGYAVAAPSTSAVSRPCGTQSSPGAFQPPSLVTSFGPAGVTTSFGVTQSFGTASPHGARQTPIACPGGTPRSPVVTSGPIGSGPLTSGGPGTSCGPSTGGGRVTGSGLVTGVMRSGGGQVAVQTTPAPMNGQRVLVLPLAPRPSPPQLPTTPVCRPAPGTPTAGSVQTGRGRSSTLARAEAYGVGSPVEVFYKGAWHRGLVVGSNNQGLVSVQFQPNPRMGALVGSFQVGHKHLRVPCASPVGHQHQGWHIGEKVYLVVGGQRVRATIAGQAPGNNVLVDYRLADGVLRQTAVPLNSEMLQGKEVVVSAVSPTEKLITPYGVKYGVHPAFFNFDKDGNMIMQEQSVQIGACEGLKPKTPTAMPPRRQIRPDEMSKLQPPSLVIASWDGPSP